MITVKGVEVRADEVNMETRFLFLTEEGQKRVFLENKEAFLVEALNSNYPTIRRLLWEEKVQKECSVDVLNQAINYCLYHRNVKVADIIALMNAVGSELSKANRYFIACSMKYIKGWKNLKLTLAQDEKTTLDILKMDAMFNEAALKLVQSNDAKLFDAIVLNPNFELDEEIEEIISTFSPEDEKIIRAKLKFLKK